jgi:hypothetical protein
LAAGGGIATGGVAVGASELGVGEAGAAGEALGAAGAACCAAAPKMPSGALSISAQTKAASLLPAPALEFMTRSFSPEQADPIPRQYEANFAWRQGALTRRTGARFMPAPVSSI